MIRVDGNRIVIEGDIDLTDSEELAAAVETVRREHPDRIIFDLTRCTFIGSTGLAAIASAGRGEMDVYVNGASTHIRRLLKLTGLDDFLEGM